MLVLQQDFSVNSNMPVLQPDANLTTKCQSYSKIPVLQPDANLTTRYQSYKKMPILQLIPILQQDANLSNLARCQT